MEKKKTHIHVDYLSIPKRNIPMKDIIMNIILNILNVIQDRNKSEEKILWKKVKCCPECSSAALLDTLNTQIFKHRVSKSQPLSWVFLSCTSKWRSHQIHSCQKQGIWEASSISMPRINRYWYNTDNRRYSASQWR